MIEITEQHVHKFLTLCDAGLSEGLGEPVPGKMCIEAAWCYALGLPHGDDPTCVAQSLRNLKIALNDANWSNNAARAAGLRRLGVAQIGSAGVLDEREFSTRVATMTIRTVVPRALRCAASRVPAHADALEAAAAACEHKPTESNSRAAANAAYAAYAAMLRSHPAAVRPEHNAAAYAAYAAAAAAYAAATALFAEADYTAAYADTADALSAEADYTTYAAADYDIVLGTFAEAVVQILIEMAAPGCQWLPLAGEAP